MVVRSRSFVLRAMFLGLLSALATLLVVPPVHAHAELESSDPADGATLGQAPRNLTFVFGEDVLEQGNAVTLTEVQTGSRLPVGPLRIEGNTVSAAWPDQSPAGQLRAAYRVVSADGHPIEGTVTFTVREALGDPIAEPVVVAAEPAASAGPSSSGAPSPSPGATETAEPGTSTGAEGDARGALIFFLGVGAAVVGVAYAGLWFMRKVR